MTAASKSAPAARIGHGSLLTTAAELSTLAAAKREIYRSAAPWPHIVLDGLVDPALVARAEAEELGPALRLRPRRFVRQVKAEASEVAGGAARAILDDLNSPPFVRFLEELTGVTDLSTDPAHHWAGIHVSPPGAFQAVHSDFRLHPATGRYHRANVLVYLNSDWQPSYRGDLELWPSDMSLCGRRVSPIAGRVVIFETTPMTIHGVPDPVGCPPGRARLSLASYYYTAAPGPDDRRQALVRRPKRPQDPWFIGAVGAKEAAGRAYRGALQVARRDRGRRS